MERKITSVILKDVKIVSTKDHVQADNILVDINMKWNWTTRCRIHNWWFNCVRMGAKEKGTLEDKKKEECSNFE